MTGNSGSEPSVCSPSVQCGTVVHPVLHPDDSSRVSGADSIRSCFRHFQRNSIPASPFHPETVTRDYLAQMGVVIADATVDEQAMDACHSTAEKMAWHCSLADWVDAKAFAESVHFRQAQNGLDSVVVDSSGSLLVRSPHHHHRHTQIVDHFVSQAAWNQVFSDPRSFVAGIDQAPASVVADSIGWDSVPMV